MSRKSDAPSFAVKGLKVVIISRIDCGQFAERKDLAKRS